MSKPVSAIERLDLVAATSGRNALAENGFAPKRLGTELAILLERSGLELEGVDAAPSAQGWPPEHSGILFSCHNDAGKTGAIILLPNALFERLFVQIYGGDRIEDVASIPSDAQLRYAHRLGMRLCASLAAAWSGSAQPQLTQAETLFDPDGQKDAFNRFDAAIQIGVDIRLPGAAQYSVQVAIAPALLSAAAPQQSRRQIATRHADWQGRMIGRAGHVPLPVRSEIAGISMPAARLLALQPGDVLPIAMPRSIPLLVGGHRFASTSMGEWQGNAALRIETLNESKPT